VQGVTGSTLALAVGFALLLGIVSALLGGAA
jgi:hypothetical protein